MLSPTFFNQTDLLLGKCDKVFLKKWKYFHTIIFLSPNQIHLIDKTYNNLLQNFIGIIEILTT